MPAAAAGLSVGDRAHQHAVALGQADRAAHAPRDARRRERDAEPHAAARPRRSTGARPASASSSSAGTATIRPPSRRIVFRPEQPPVGVDERAAAGAARQRGGVLDAAGDRAPARAADVAARRGDEPERGAQAAPAAVGERDTGAPIAARDGVGLPLDRLDVAGVDLRPPRGRSRGRRRRRVPVSRAAVGEVDGHLVAAQVVGVREDAAGGDDHAAAAPPAAAEADHRGADALGGRARWPPEGQ